MKIIKNNLSTRNAKDLLRRNAVAVGEYHSVDAISGSGEGTARESEVYTATYTETPEEATVVVPAVINVKASGTTAKVSVAADVYSVDSTSFTDASHIETVALSDTIETIAEGTFAAATRDVSAPALKSISGEGVKTIGSNAFTGCSNLASVKMANVEILGASAFESCSSLTSIEMSKVENINDRTFAGCTSLTSVNIDGAKTIGANVFEGANLTEINLPNAESIDPSTLNEICEMCSYVEDGIKYNGTDKNVMIEVIDKSITSLKGDSKYINDGVYDGLTLSELDMPKSVSGPALSHGLLSRSIKSVDVAAKSINENAFKYYTGSYYVGLPNLHNVSIRQAINTGSNLFGNCSSLASVSLSNVTNIVSHAFYACSSLTSVSLPEATCINAAAFEGCKSLTSISLPKVIKIKGKSGMSGAFGGCTSLISVDLPVVTTIGYYAFCGCTSISSVSALKVTTIGESAFSYCIGLTSIDIPNIKKIDNNAFNQCPLYQEGIYKWNGSNKQALIAMSAISSVTTLNISDNIVYVTDDLTNYYSYFYNSNNMYFNASDKKVLIKGANITSVNENSKFVLKNAFNSCGSLTSVSLPKATNIGNNAFYWCTSLKSVSLPQATYIGNSAFYNCSSLTSVDLPEVTTISEYSFQGCSSLTSLSLSEATTIGYSAFYACRSLTSVSLPKVTTIGNDAFYYCTSLKSVSLPQVTEIDGYAFYQCSMLTSVSLPQATTIGDGAFYYCTSLTSVSLPQATTVGNYAFGSCSILTSVSLPKVTTIGQSAFGYCSSLTSVDLPNIEIIYGDGDSGAFGYCSSLTEVTIGDKVKYIGKNNYNGTYVFGPVHSENRIKLTIKATTPPSLGSIYSINNVKEIYVPASAVSAYKSATNWSSYASKIFAIPE